MDSSETFQPNSQKRNVQFSVDELIAISNVVNEVMGWVGEQDCETRLGVTFTELQAIQEKVNESLL